MPDLNFKFKIQLLFLLLVAFNRLPAGDLPWYYLVRTSGHPLTAEKIDAIIEDARQTHLLGIEVDNDITGRYDSFLHPEAKLEELRLLAQKVHAINNYAFVYIAGLECITPNADERQHTFFKDHPDWLQRDINGRPAIFSSKDAFWIHEGDEDVWISPFARPWRQMYMERVRQIAATGIDGIYVDIPYWMTHFEGWEETWASFDDFTVQAFQQASGLNARTDLKLGDFSDANFRKWIDFRLQAIRDFLAEIDRNVKQVNPQCLTIAEIYPGLDFEAVRVGADVSLLYDVVDVITHEYSEGAYMASDRQAFDWYRYLIGMLTFRSLANGKPSWMLSYSWDCNKNVDAGAAMRLLFASQLFAGVNSWDAATHVMSGSNNLTERRKIFKWIAAHQNHFYGPLRQKAPLGIYFSAKTRNYFAKTFIPSFYGFALMALHAHQPFEIVNQKSLARFNGALLVLPNVKILTDKEIADLKSLQQKGVFLFFTQDSSSTEIPSNWRSAVRVLNQSKLKVQKTCWGRQYYEQASAKFNKIVQSVNSGDTLQALARNYLNQLSRFAKWPSTISLEAPVSLAMRTYYQDGKLHIALLNFNGIKGGQHVVPQPLRHVTLKIDKSVVKSNKIHFLNFAGQVKTLTGKNDSTHFRWEIPQIVNGAFLWVD